MPEQASSGHSFQLGILPERKIDRRALAASYGFVVLLALLLINLGMLFPDRLQLKQYRVTSLIPMPALRPEHVPVNRKPLKVKLLPPAPVFQQPKLVVPHEVRHITAPEPVEAPKVVMNTFTAPQLKMTSGGARPQLLHTGDFSGSSVAPTVNAAVQKVQTGGFGDPNGLKGTGKEGAKFMPRRPAALTCLSVRDKATDRAERKALKAQLPAPISATVLPPEARAMAAAMGLELQPAASELSKWCTADRSWHNWTRVPLQIQLRSRTSRSPYIPRMPGI